MNLHHGHMSSFTLDLPHCVCVVANPTHFCPRCPLLDQEAMERVAGWAVTHHLARNKAPVVKDGQLHVDAADVVAALGSLKTLEAESGSVKSFLKDIVTENDHEKRILSEVRKSGIWCAAAWHSLLGNGTWSRGPTYAGAVMDGYVHHMSLSTGF